MGKNLTISIADVLFSGVQRRLLALLFGQPERSFYANEIARLALTGRGALQRELERMTAAGLITLTLIGRQKHYQANRQAPVFAELRGIVIKTFGLADILRTALEPLAASIDLALIHGSVARGEDHAGSDIDLLIVADTLAYSDLFEILTPSESTLGRKINPTLYKRDEFASKYEADNHFVRRVIDQPKIFLIGSEDDLPRREPAQPAEDRQAQG